ncbi:dynein regulatory complex protein 1-like [Clytia hemisphaerica]|uniref:Dynein regulatory complex protein 1 n=1 Tax=Clytia hemisphaerica TaxID=252671 RepID=A0A7M5V2P5_9CNID|eukprot:TCONS_00000099-protein
MASQIKDLAMDEDIGPSVDSPLIEERIAARRLRITRRMEALKKDTLGEDVTVKVSSEPTKELSKSRKQIEESFQQLAKLISDGTELVSNIEVACDSREATLRQEEDENVRQRTQKLQDEVKTAAIKFEQITKKWEGALKKDVPQQLKEMLESQRELCDEMIGEKDNLIDELQQDLKQKDDQYVKDLRKQSEDADLMLERMEEQIKTLNRAHKKELDNVENAFYSERRDVLQSHKNKWTNQSEQRRQKEQEYLELRQKHVENYEEQLNTLRVQDAEEYNMVKIKLETDVQILEQNLQQMKATYQLNQEKLEYNFQVLKKRDEENTITKSQQKRKITRLQDLLNNLKFKLKKQEQQYKDENQAFSDDLKRMTEQYKELQKKFRHFQTTDNKKFVDIWKMNEEQTRELIEDLLSADRIIFEQQLGMTWRSPEINFLQKVGPINGSKKAISKTALDAATEILAYDESADSNSHGKMTAKTSTKEGSTKQEIEHSHEDLDAPLSTGAIKRMLELLCDESGFLVEAKLIKLLAPIEKDEQSLMKLDAIFNAIGIESERDIVSLGKYFYNRYLEKLEQPEDEEEQNGEESLTNENAPITEGANQDQDQVDTPTNQKQEACDLTNQETASNESLESIPMVVRQELIHPNEVVKSLRKFIDDNREPFKDSRKSNTVRIGSSSGRDSSYDEQYWTQLASVIDLQRERLWDGMVSGFEKYSQILKERSTLIGETDSLRQQNSELRMLLHQYLSSKVNQELEIPPTRVLQVETGHSK